MSETYTNDEVIAELRASIPALIAYEYIITVNEEVTMIWKRKWTIVTWVFFANRYLMVLNALFDSLPSLSFQPILISRFLLNLRQVGASQDPQNTTVSRFSIPALRVPTLASSALGNMGEDLDHGYTGDVDEEVEFERTGSVPDTASLLGV
ncbi:hypothetical protein PHLCEN_2v8504 [Hermanssonia centrifuga]|uniref:DUF6533 domain-containing protein n=1 Tax=Hermanssonia centrifuga TaxID=98765 RepID=A0A2R6NTG6_9APHY|nr:hypothetical protein PHLCEN_2v8504 [Hermanssonia centrifuga]